MFKSSHIAEQHLFSMFPSSFAFDFDGVGLTTGFGSIHVVEQHLFSINPSILAFDFDLILREFLAF